MWYTKKWANLWFWRICSHLITTKESQHHLQCWGMTFLSEAALASILLLFTYLLLRWVFFAARGLSPAMVSRGYSLVAVLGLLPSCGALASHCCGFSCCRAQAPECTGFSRCGTRAQCLCRTGMWGLPGSGIEPGFPAMTGGFLTTGPPGKPLALILTLTINPIGVPIWLPKSFLQSPLFMSIVFRALWEWFSFSALNSIFKMFWSLWV